MVRVLKTDFASQRQRLLHHLQAIDLLKNQTQAISRLPAPVENTNKDTSNVLRQGEKTA